ncbi:initiator tRNA phosphoribosyl transferase family protein [Zea mays]|uniref:Initiator tRNA phosphoribosyl transferase family protein n=1 Tax=Zea mays TaxID=4577 RepID=A0A1D6P1W0_MAIZE|nr:initiator tRNA phosphoribosyl transferase family protein [Zea mays]
MAAAAPEAADEVAPSATLSVYKAARCIKRRASTLYNALRSVAEDAAFVAEVAALWPSLPLVANLRCGLWNLEPEFKSSTLLNGDAENNSDLSNWDSSVHLPVWVLGTEKNAIEGRIDEWTDQFESCGADIHSLAVGLQKPLRPLWISQRTRIWLNEVPELESWDFTPIILISASDAVATQRMSSEFSWHYIPGAGDDEESWARGLTPTLFWKHSYDLIDAGPDRCNQIVADIVEKDRVYRAQRGEHCPQITCKSLRSLAGAKCNDDQTTEMCAMNLDHCTSTRYATTVLIMAFYSFGLEHQTLQYHLLSMLQVP